MLRGRRAEGNEVRGRWSVAARTGKSLSVEKFSEKRQLDAETSSA